MRLVLATLTILTAAFAPLPALASCGAERIGTIEQRLDRAGAVQAIGLQAGLILRTGSAGGMQATRDAPNDPAKVSTAEGVGHASSLIVRDANADRRGDRRSCENTRHAVKGVLGASS